MNSLDRRRFLRGLGTCMALPALESLGADPRAATGARPVRPGFVYLPNGVNVDQWEPKGGGSNLKLSQTLEPLAPVQEHIQVLSGLKHDKARANGDGGEAIMLELMPPSSPALKHARLLERMSKSGSPSIRSLLIT